MAALATALDQATRAAALQECQARENEIAKRFPTGGRAPSPTGDAALALTSFVAWCVSRGVRSCPARPTTIAFWIEERSREGLNQAAILRTLEAMAAQHDSFGLANPAATYAVRLALEPVVTVEPPRSWPKAEKIKFSMLPGDVKAIIAQRERQREIEVRRLQNKTAEQLKTVSGSAVLKDANTEKAETMPKKREGWELGEGPYSSSKDLGITGSNLPPDNGAGAKPSGQNMGNDISETVERNSRVNQGFPAGLKR